MATRSAPLADATAWRAADLRAAARAFAAAAREAGGTPAPGVVAFPEAQFALLRRFGLHAPMVRTLWGGLPDPAGHADLADLLDVLRTVGRASLPLGRLYEGHLNALQLIGLFGTPAQQAAALRDLEDGRIFAVWNSDAAEPLRLEPAVGGLRLRGGKSFASGAGRVERPIVTAALPDGRRQMVLLDDRVRGAKVDPASWQPVGMEASCSFAIDLTGIAIEPRHLLGGLEDYHRQPWFGAGALRFAAVQLGGAEALLELTRAHLKARDRHRDPHQVARVASMAIAVESGVGWLERGAAQADRCQPHNAAQVAERVLAYAHMARTAIERICLDVQEAAIRSIGAAGLLRPHPMEQIVRDLMLYLRQPAPDGALAAVGRHVLEREAAIDRLWSPEDDG